MSAYERVIRRAVKRPILTTVLALLTVPASFLLLPAIKQKFFPAAERDQFIIEVDLPIGMRLEATDAASDTWCSSMLIACSTENVSGCARRCAAVPDQHSEKQGADQVRPLTPCRYQVAPRPIGLAGALRTTDGSSGDY